MQGLVAQAQSLGADAVVGIDLDYEVLGANSGMLMVSASGSGGAEARPGRGRPRARRPVDAAVGLTAAAEKSLRRRRGA
jgi:hypothetical protein